MQAIKEWIRSIVSPITFERIAFFYRVGYLPHIKNPRTFNEKILYRKFFQHNSLFVELADKWHVRNYIERKVGLDFLNKVYFIGNNPKNINYNEIPKPFIIKFTHSSGKNFIIKDTNDINISEIELECNLELNRRLDTKTNEYWYNEIKPQIIIEELLNDREHDIPLDFKFFVFHGKCKAIQLDIGRYKYLTRCIMDTEWNLIPVSKQYPIGIPIKKPKLLKKMIEVAEKISEDFDFCRVDLYCPNDEYIRFGEMTFSPAAGRTPFHPRKYDFEFGKYWNLKI